MKLKADLHLHTSEGDRYIAYDARTLIDRAAREGFRVLSITNHDALTFSADLASYARERGILLIPGVEATIERKHVLLYNVDVQPSRIRTFTDLRRHRGPDWLVVAPHPFYPTSFCLGKRLPEEIDLFDAIEFSHFYVPRFDFNRRAVALAREVGLPLIGTSDSHLLPQFGTTFSLIDAEPTIASVLSAIKTGHVNVVSRPLAIGQCVRIGSELTVADLRMRMKTARRALRGRRRGGQEPATGRGQRVPTEGGWADGDRLG